MQERFTKICVKVVKAKSEKLQNARVRTRENMVFTAVCNSYLLPEQIVYWQQKKIC